MYKVYARTLWSPATLRFNWDIVQRADTREFDIAWVDKGIHVRRYTLQRLSARGIFTVHHMTDDFMNRRHSLLYRFYKQAIPDYHVHLSSNSNNLRELISLGAKAAVQTYLGFDPELCMPGGLPATLNPAYSSDVAFIGFWRSHLDEHLLPLIRAGIRVRTWGSHWNKSPHAREYRQVAAFRQVSDKEYATILASASIALCFLARENRNVSTGRSFEIPAVGAFMLAERTDEHLSFYEEGREAEFFSDPTELLHKVKYYLSRPQERLAIARAGHVKAVTAGYSYLERIRSDLAHIRPLLDNFHAQHNRRGRRI